MAFLNSGKLPDGKALAPAVETALFTLCVLMVEGIGWWNDLDVYKRGYYQGYILFEVILAVVGGILTGGAATGVVLAKGGVKMGQVLKFLIPKLEKFIAATRGAADDLAEGFMTKLRNMSGHVTNAKAGGWCFVAGTMIMTPLGAKAIERIEVGDLVWSAHEESGETGFRPVMELYRNVSPEIWRIAYDHDGDPFTSDAEIDCTPEHPFWCAGAGRFVPARELVPGVSKVRLLDGIVTEVTAANPLRGPPEKTQVYNFAVADHHTYFAGQGGVWVHNSCRPDLDEYALKFDGFLDASKKNLGDTDEAFDEAFEKIIRSAIDEDELDQDALAEIGAFILRNSVGKIKWIDPTVLRYSQRTAGGNGRAASIRQSMQTNGWVPEEGPINAILTKKGLVAFDNTRPAVAVELGLKKVTTKVHDLTDPLPSDFPAEQLQFLIQKADKHGLPHPSTWEDALRIRTTDNGLPLEGKTMPAALKS